MTTAEILAIEDLNNDQIHFIAEGIFLKAYQKSAYLFVRDCAAMKPTKKHIKAVGREVVSIGFPAASLLKYSGEKEINKIDERHSWIQWNAIDEEAYNKWFADIPISELRRVQPPTTVSVTGSEASPVSSSSATGKSLMVDRVIEALLRFRLDNSTPMDCMFFIKKLQSELADKNGYL